MASEMIDVEMSSSSESSDSSSESENESESSSHSNNTNNSVTYNNNNAGNRKKPSNSGFLGEMERVKIKAFIKKAVCEYCGASGAKSSFYSKNKRFCSFSCSVHGAAAEATSPQPIPSSGGKTSAQLKTIKRTSTQTGKAKKQKQNVAAATNELGPSFDWKIPYLKMPDFEAAPVSCFRHASLSDMWDNVIVGMKLEVENKDCENFGNLFPNFYWIATVTKIAGYMVCLRYEGFGMDDTKDFWINLCVESVHPVGWCASQGKPLIPPKTIEHKHSDWKGFLVKRLTGARTLPANFAQKVQESLKSRFRVGMKLEVVDKNRISCVRVATVQEIVGGRLHIAYEQAEDLDEGFWCHERSPLIHPVGWAQIVGHDLRASLDYAKKSLQKTLLKKFDLNDCTWEMFLPVKNVSSDLKFKEGMKLEAIDPLNLSTICVATVTRVLRNNYLMIGIDGMMAANGSDWFCYHASSPHIFPVGFCDLNKIHLTPPRGHEGEFNWFNYLNETNSAAAPVALFKKELPNHGFKEGMHVEAVDLMEPRLICVGKVTRVVGRLLRVHFEGWDISYDQWCDCGSPDLFPVGWCQVAGYRLEPPREEENSKKVKKYKPPVYKGHRKRGKPKKTTGGGKKEPKMQIKLEPDVSDMMNQNYPNLTYSSTQTNSKKSATSVNEVSSSRPVPTPSKVSNVTTKKSLSGVALSSTHSEVDPERWTILDVAQFLRINECGAYCQVFSQQRIDGQKFLNMSKEDVMSLTGMKVGPSLKIFDLITQLKNKKIKF